MFNATDKDNNVKTYDIICTPQDINHVKFYLDHSSQKEIFDNFDVLRSGIIDFKILP
jgi:hypothetical protein